MDRAVDSDSGKLKNTFDSDLAQIKIAKRRPRVEIAGVEEAPRWGGSWGLPPSMTVGSPLSVSLHGSIYWIEAQI